MIVGVIGMGYVGIPEAVMIAERGKAEKVYGFQRNSKTSGYKINLLNSGKLPFEDPQLAAHLNHAIANNMFECTSNFSRISECDVIVIAVQTPVDHNMFNSPDYSHISDAIETIEKYMKDGVLVVIVSTIPPGTTEKIKNQLKCTGKKFDIVHAPERVMPGHLVDNYMNYHRIVGGEPPAVQRYFEIMPRCKGFVMVSAVEAEITKCAENAIRATQIAMANQIAILCDANGANFRRVKRGIDTLTGIGITRALLEPGAGVGGHCLTKDGYLLSLGFMECDTFYEDSIFTHAIRINSCMPHYLWHVTEKALVNSGKLPSESTIIIMGWSYLPGSSDTRNSPAIDFKILAERVGCTVIVHDPICGMDASSRLNESDAIVIITPHYEITKLLDTLPDTVSPRIIVDGRNTINPSKFSDKGWTVKAIGRGDL